jgi:hypothetical protein
MHLPEEQVLAATPLQKQINELTCPVCLRRRLVGAGVAVSMSRLRFCSIHSTVTRQQGEATDPLAAAR